MSINMIQHIVGPYMSSNYTSLRNRKNFQTSEGGHMVHFGHVLVFPNSVKNIDIQFIGFLYFFGSKPKINWTELAFSP